MNDYCYKCSKKITSELVFSDGCSKGDIRFYCIECFYLDAKVGFRQLNLKCKCGNNLRLIHGEKFVSFNNNFTYEDLNYVCETYDEKLEGKQVDLDEHTHYRIPVCRDLLKIERGLLKTYIEDKYIKEELNETIKELDSAIDKNILICKLKRLNDLNYKSNFKVEILKYLLREKLHLNDDDLIDTILNSPHEIIYFEFLSDITNLALTKSNNLKNAINEHILLYEYQKE